MSMTREDVLRAAMELSEADRLWLATELMEGVLGEFPRWALDAPQLLLELESRSHDGSAGIPWESAKAQLRRDLQG